MALIIDETTNFFILFSPQYLTNKRIFSSSGIILFECVMSLRLQANSCNTTARNKDTIMK